MRTALDDGSGERNVRGNHEVAGRDEFDDARIGRVETRRHLDRLDERRRRRAQILVGHQRHLHFGAPRGPEQHVLDDGGAGVSVDQHLHENDSSTLLEGPRM